MESPWSYSFSSCFGHFLYNDQKDPYNLEPLPVSESISKVEYKIAYIALCIEDNNQGCMLFNNLKEIPSIDPEYVQFGCAE